MSVTPTPSITPSNTATMTPTLTQCPGICFSGVGTNADGFITTILQDRFNPQKMMVVGRFTTYNGVTKRTMVRSYTDGEIDNTFDAGTGFAPSFIATGVEEVSQQADGKYVCTGSFTSFRGVSRNFICRVNNDGTLDTSFVVGTGYTRQTLYSLIQSSGKILVCSLGANQYSGTNIGALSRLNTDGSLDTTFNNIDILGTSGTLLSKIHENPDGTFYVCGNLTKSGRRGLLKLNSDGSYASSDPFNTSGIGFNNNVADFQVQGDGKLICVGDFGQYNGVACPLDIVRINPNGTRDLTFTGTGSNNYIYEVELQGSKYVVCSFASSYNGTPTNQLFRINNDGSYDATFNDGNFTSITTEDLIVNTSILTGATNDNGYIFVGGYFNSYDGVLASNIVKTDRNGFIQDCDIIEVSPTPTTTRTPSVTPTNTTTPSRTPTQTTTPSRTPSNTPTMTVTSSPTATIGVTPTMTPSNTATMTPTTTQTSTPTMTSTPTNTIGLTPTNTPSNTMTSTPTATPQVTPTMTPTTPELCPCNCWSLTYPSGEMPAGLEVRYRDCQTNTVTTQTILSLETIDNLDGTYTANICVQTGGTYNTPVCVSGSTEIICDPFQWIQGGVCCIPADCAIECCVISILTNGSLDVSINTVDVDGSAATLVGGSMPNTPGNGTTLCSTTTGTVDITVSTFNSVAGQKITLCDSNGICTCYNITGTGPSTWTWTDAALDCVTPVTILAEDGSC